MSGKFIGKLLERDFELSKEVLSIIELLEEKNYHNRHGYTNVFSVINSYFRTWESRETYIDLDDLAEGMGINRIYDNASIRNISLDDFLYFSEYAYNISFIPSYYHEETKHEYNAHLEYDLKFISSNLIVLRDNIEKVLDSLNYKIEFFESLTLFKVVEKDFMVSEAADIVQGEYALGEAIYLYGHRGNKGKLFEKADILSRLYKWFEERRSKIRESYKSIADNIGELSNNLDVRHAPKPKHKTTINNMSDEEIEEWYDKLFKLYLSAIILHEYLEVKPDIKELKAKLNG